MTMRYLAGNIANFDLRRTLAGIVAIVCVISLAGVSLNSTGGLGDLKGGGWDWSFGLAEEIASEGVKVESKSTVLASSAADAVLAEEYPSIVISSLVPVLTLVFDLLSSHIPFVSLLANLGAHSATSPPARA